MTEFYARADEFMAVLEEMADLTEEQISVLYDELEHVFLE